MSANRKKTLVIVAGAIRSLITPDQAIAQPPFQPPMGPFGRGGWNPWGGGGTIDWLTLLGLIGAAVFFVLWIMERRKGGPKAGSDSALDILKSRYARGEEEKCND